MAAHDIDTTTVPVYQLKSQVAPSYSLMNYGMAGNPSYEFVKAVQTGEVKFNNTDPYHQQMIDEYEARRLAGDTPPDAPSWSSVAAELAISTLPFVANRFGQAFSTADGKGLAKVGSAAKETVTDLLGKNVKSKDALFDIGGANTPVGSTVYPTAIKRFKTADSQNAYKEFSSIPGYDAKTDSVLSNSDASNYLLKNPEKAEEFGLTNGIVKQARPDTSPWSSPENVSGSVGLGLSVFAASLVAGEGAKKAAKRAVGSGLGKYLGSAIGGPIGGWIGGALGGMAGGRVICNELMRQGVLDRKHVLLDYRFTRDYLTPTHVNGYHVWAVWMVKQMRKGKFVKFWKHVAGHRANEIAYIYGERDKPDYLGKVYRKILEPICWSIGVFCKKSDWSILYKTKEI